MISRTTCAQISHEELQGLKRSLLDEMIRRRDEFQEQLVRHSDNEEIVQEVEYEIASLNSQIEKLEAEV